MPWRAYLPSARACHRASSLGVCSYGSIASCRMGRGGRGAAPDACPAAASSASAFAKDAGLVRRAAQRDDSSGEGKAVARGERGVGRGRGKFVSASRTSPQRALPPRTHKAIAIQNVITTADLGYISSILDPRHTVFMYPGAQKTSTVLAKKSVVLILRFRRFKAIRPQWPQPP